MRYIVGYIANERGRDAVALASTLAAHTGGELDLTMVLPQAQPPAARVPSEPGYDELLAEQAEEWLKEGLALVGGQLPAEASVRYAESFAEGLIQEAEEEQARMIVIGAGRHGLLGRYSIGSVASALLHSSPVPVALAPRGYQAHPGLGRVTCAVGTRAGADNLLETAVDAAARQRIPLRLISLVAVGAKGAAASETSTEQARTHARTVLEEAAARLPAEHEVTVEVAHGDSIEDAVEELQWHEDELLVIGSSRLAQHNRLFLGSTANKILRSLPVPMVVVPRNYSPSGGDGAARKNG
ncbi:universal stress protein [Arthrobacter sp. I2-34]|uniref:Universal stress protein n=1 Tax=Arthrobacter hankyongi TaxID=2904801 RepID=A0ABS9L384_9MICC|nr:universal stress protein [Arthrobacter hankyongi]MCG2621088.1 universal stress protein [Arthrobacter hankyongi]